MRKIIVVFIVVIAAGLSLFLSGGAVRPAIRVNNFVMSQKEFEEYFRQTAPEKTAKKEYLRQLIDTKLILQEAEKQGLHKDKSFLESLERFYEKALLKAALAKKSEETANLITITDQEIKAYYDEMAKKGADLTPLVDSRDEIKWYLFRQKQTQIISEWVRTLRLGAKIEIKKGVIDDEKKP